ncbi:hypothetical protein [Feifania hominis]|uniref:Uncharacterized protein n=1 Tax=Feifania hominis TaxID=2763660 RepID=A0A926DH89_9FIRM|nr:hypothetical protein [Feifania hominis]MBC8537254.1 hypothetical protein [Feifania hominis]
MKNEYYDIIEEYYRPLAEEFGLKLVYLEEQDPREGNPFLLVGKDFVIYFYTFDFVYMYYYEKNENGDYHRRDIANLIALSCTNRERAKVSRNLDDSKRIERFLILHALTLQNYWKSLLMGDRHWIAEFKRCRWNSERVEIDQDMIKILKPYLH